MSDWLQIFAPNQNRSFDAFEQQSVIILKGAESLCELLVGGGNIQIYSEKIRGLEIEGDTITRSILADVRKQWVTPFFRSDISALINALDDSIDSMHQFAKSVETYEFSTFPPEMRAISDTILRSAELTKNALPLLRASRKNADRLNEFVKEISTLEEQAESLAEQGLKSAYLKYRDSNPLGFISESKLYAIMLNVSVSFEKISHQVANLMIEQH